MIFIENLVELIPDILWILVSGYLYLKIYDFVSYTKEEKNYNYIFLKSVVCGTVLNATIGSLTGYIIEPWDTIAYIISVVIISFVLSKTMNSVLFRSILKKLNICRTFNQNIWHDLADRKHSVWVDLRSEAVSLYLQLDSDDQSEIRGEMKQMLKADKYLDEKTFKVKIAARNGEFKEANMNDTQLEEIMNLPDVDDLL